MRITLIATILAFTAHTSLAQGIEFFHGTWEEGLAKAKAEDRIIFVDAFTTWCGPCKNMAANTFTKEEVGDFFNQNFVPMKIDMEKEMGLEFRKKYPVSAYPTLFFIDADGEVVQKSVGAKSPGDLIALGEAVVAKYDKSYKYAAAYEAGDRSYQLVYDYVKALNKAGKPTVKMCNEFIADQKDLSTPENLKFILEAATLVDCKCFDLLIEHKKEIAGLVTEDAVDAQIRKACGNTVHRAIEFESPELVTLAGETMKRHLPSEAELFKSASSIQYALALHELTNIEDMVNTHVKKFLKNDSPALYQLAMDLDKYASDHEACRRMAVEIAGKAAKSEDVKHISGYASLVQKNVGKQEAIQILDEALKKYEGEETKASKELKALRNKIQNG